MVRINLTQTALQSVDFYGGSAVYLLNYFSYITIPIRHRVHTDVFQIYVHFVAV